MDWISDKLEVDDPNVVQVILGNVKPAFFRYLSEQRTKGC